MPVTIPICARNPRCSVKRQDALGRTVVVMLDEPAWPGYVPTEASVRRWSNLIWHIGNRGWRSCR